MNDLKVALVGCGYVADGHLKAWRRIKYVDVVAVSDLNESLARNTALKWSIPRCYTSLFDLLEKEKIDIVDICTPPHTHATLAVKAMEAGINVIVEKPMTMTVSDAEKIVRCQKETGVKAGVLHNWLFDVPVLEAKSLVKKGLLGEVFSFEIETLNTKEDSMAANEQHWCHKFPGGRFSEMLAHPIYLTRYFLGSGVSVGDVHVSKVGSYLWMKSDELCAVFKVGQKLGRAYASFNSSRDAINVSIYGREGIVKMELINSILTFLPRRKMNRFSKGFDSVRQAGQIVKWTGKNMLSVVFNRWMSGHEMYIKLFAESVIKNCEPPVSVVDGLAVVKTLEETCTRIAKVEAE